ncbi:DUF1758 domain-containing protein [Trichonephila inaurata madagascariensis]|uniref:DUF1758 domain-containing protein n=1 Tax=Trichonephila inaurata madagascariensis TaxID=2747483 RepID=A0A8X6YJL7_9ARAC|nr:DUF1758 domain-containing protein [Trichonephila inaurata madagascariensis]
MLFKKCAKNDASLIQSDQDSFESLMEVLINRYENKKAYSQKGDIHITEMLSMPKIQSENPAQLRLLIETIGNRRLFQLYLKTTEVSSLQDFFSFLETRCIQLESILKTNPGTKKYPRDSRSIASKRLDQLWRHLDRDPKLNNLYTKLIEENLSLDHMEEIINIDDITSEEGLFLPYHGVLRAGNRSRPLRVVFNG